MGTPAVFTAYNRQEAVAGAEKLDGLGAAFTLRPEENKWKDLMPYPETFAKRYEIYYKNFWWYLVKGQK